MFEIANLSSEPRSLSLVTSRNNDIKNYVAPEPAEKHVQAFNAIRARYSWTERRPAYGICNCAGLVWASRRAAIDSQDAWNLILLDDNYRRLHLDETPMPGDLVIYEESKSGFLHVGVVLELAPLIHSSSNYSTRVLSKLSDSYGEVIHREHDILAWYRSMTLSPTISARAKIMEPSKAIWAANQALVVAQ